MKRAAILPQGRGDVSPRDGDIAGRRKEAGGARPRAKNEPAEAKPSRLWFWFIAAFCVQAAAWVAWLVIAAHHRVQEVPLVP